MYLDNVISICISKMYLDKFNLWISIVKEKSFWYLLQIIQV